MKNGGRRKEERWGRKDVLSKLPRVRYAVCFRDLLTSIHKAFLLLNPISRTTNLR